MPSAIAKQTTSTINASWVANTLKFPMSERAQWLLHVSFLSMYVAVHLGQEQHNSCGCQGGRGNCVRTEKTLHRILRSDSMPLAFRLIGGTDPYTQYIYIYVHIHIYIEEGPPMENICSHDNLPKWETLFHSTLPTILILRTIQRQDGMLANFQIPGHMFAHFLWTSAPKSCPK